MNITEKLLEQVVSQAPGLVIMYLLVSSFLKAQKERDELFSKAQAERDDVIKNLHTEHLAARGESREAIRENTESNKEVVSALITLRETIVSHRLRDSVLVEDRKV